MKDARSVMGMRSQVHILGPHVSQSQIEAVYGLWDMADQKFSPFKPTSQISRLNRGDVTRDQLDDQARYVLDVCDQLKTLSGGYFNAWHSGMVDPSGFVKGWAISEAARMLDAAGVTRYLVEIAGDMQLKGLGPDGQPWRIGIINPFDKTKLAKVLAITDLAVATSGTYERGHHIYNPLTGQPVTDLASLTVIGPAVDRVDALSTAAFCMGPTGLGWLKLQGFDAMAISADGNVVVTDGFNQHVARN